VTSFSLREFLMIDNFYADALKTRSLPVWEGFSVYFIHKRSALPVIEKV
jgi:hypothetical protein